MKVILEMNDGTAGMFESRLLSVEAEEGEVTIWMEDSDEQPLFWDMNEEETLMLVVALLDALKVANPVYAEIEDIINKLINELDEEEVEE